MIERILTLTSFDDVFIKIMTSSFDREKAINNLLKEFELCKKSRRHFLHSNGRIFN
ncbi:hypothetical protein P20495_0686 [Pseudoalteromonas sp. BSi20495]|nr:hypothetical protein P20495_0686 [Pseudoalteromonas sp. BSi20495]